MSIATDRWIDFFCMEYLDEFIRDGGATVKFVVGDAHERQAVADALRREGERREYFVAQVDSALIKIHMVDELFCAVARRVDWLDLADKVRERFVKRAGYPAGPVSTTYATIAAATGIEPNLVRNELQREFSKRVFRDYAMTQEFRVAMMALCLEPMANSYQGDGTRTDLVVDWLRGDVGAAPMKQVQIYQKVARHNARELLISLAHWIRQSGLSGTVLALDISAYLVRTKSDVARGGNHYTRAATMDLYEALRQFVDSIDEMEGVAIVVLAAPEFLADDARGYEIYQALRARVATEVSDAHRDNPVAGLIRIGGAS